ncbi:hypothetical protein ABZ178_20210 [Streptomyces massasporeus]|uniref:hypothetical protein n=1 Tax=Streptomyces massasporeus TaxID=67324 RepID=UPI00167BBB8E|nr:hypothetical protein [Streptomyces massasporeus]GGV81169.1 hypothetical protein GCM10010228_53920 [Streptomyces massasporeus]
MPRSTTARRLGAALVCAALGLTACSSGSEDDGTPGSRSSAAPPVDFKNPPKVSATPSMAASVNLELPLEAYAWTDDELRTRRQGEDLLAAACMGDYGFDLEPRPSYRGDKALRDANRYGVSDPDKASRFGYHPDPAARGPKPPKENYSSAESLVLFGPREGESAKAEQNGKTIPKGGCWGKSLRDLASKGPKVHPDQEEFADQLAGFTYQESQKDSRVKKAFSAWSACMKKQGYTYSSPMAAVEDKRFTKAGTASAEEIRVATADVTCKRENNVIGVWYAVEVAYQERAVEKNEQLLNTLKERKSSILKAAAAAGAR